MDGCRAVDGFLEGAVVLGGDEVGQVGVCGVFLGHRVEVVEQDVGHACVEVGAAHGGIGELVGGQLVAADRVDQHHAGVEGVLVTVQEVLPHRGPAPAAAPFGFLPVSDEHDVEFVAQTCHLGGAGDLGQVGEAGSECAQDGLPVNEFFELREVAGGEADRVDHRVGHREAGAQEFRFRVVALVDPVVVHGPFREPAACRGQQAVGVVAVGMREHEQAPELVRAQAFEAAREDADLRGPVDQAVVDLLPEGGVVTHRVGAVQGRDPHRRVLAGRGVLHGGRWDLVLAGGLRRL